MTDKYDPNYISRFYDNYGEREWQRFEQEAGAANLVNLHLHTHYLRRFIQPDSHVLDVGAGPGRFTIEMARIGASVTVGDISSVQLEMNRRRLEEAGLEGSVVARQVMDVTDLSAIPDGTYDAAVCYGGALSYVFDRAGQALEELLRVTKPGGYVLLSVMSLLGSTNAFLTGVLKVAEEFGLEATNRVNSTGDLYGEISGGHQCHMFRWSELEALLKAHHCEIVAASASNFLSLHNKETAQQAMADPQLWQTLLAWELDYCKEPGALDGGTHIIAVVRR
ncbi:MAG: class I SAM-dependent methyltransferase [Chloroflexota bacterium]|nr:class I SAM-dependent methyltransferase [Chloroflexota bacterium]MDQ5867650.1 class I SAM-dependent methyltransferase [Chloroflexota bacterium]